MKVRESSPRMDPILIEKMIMALMLVEELSFTKLQFIFKGGTSLALMLGTLQRFSIDIDILIKDEPNIEAYFDTVLRSHTFIRYEEDIRDGTLPKKHYKFFFNSEIQMQESHILLDILVEENLYSQLNEVEIRSSILSADEKGAYVTCPARDCLLGDKLTAFAPHTTGILYGKDKELEIIKQLFDIASLFDGIEDLGLVRKTHAAIASKELIYRGKTHLSPQEVLQDTFNTGILIGLRGYSGDPNEYTELVSGISRLKGFIFSGNFTPDSAILCASKATILAAHLIKRESEMTKFDPAIDLSGWMIQRSEFNRINRLKKTNPEAFFYYYNALDKMDLVNER
jgi:hypothetical protein